MANVNDLLVSIVLKFETTVFLVIPRDFRMCHNSFDLPTLSESINQRVFALLLRLTLVVRNRLFHLIFINMQPRFLECFKEFVR